MGPHLRHGDDAAARLRGPGAGAFLGPPGALPAAVRRLQHPGLRPGDAGADVLPAAAADDPAVPQAAHHLHAEEPAAAQGIGVAAARVRREQVQGGQRRVGREHQAGQGEAPDPVQRQEKGIKDMAIVRVAQIYPFPHDEFQAQINLYSKAQEVLWCQEEPGNQGAWHRIQHYILRHMRAGQVLGYAMRASSASPAAGYASLHSAQQKELVEAAFAPLADNLVMPVQGTAGQRTKHAG